MIWGFRRFSGLLGGSVFPEWVEAGGAPKKAPADGAHDATRASGGSVFPKMCAGRTISESLDCDGLPSL